VRGTCALVELGEPRLQPVHFGLELRGLRVGLALIRVHGPLLPLEDFGSGVERPLLLFNSDFPLSGLLLPIEDVERFLLEEAQIFRDLGLHRIGLAVRLFRLASAGAPTLGALLDPAAPARSPLPVPL